MPGVGSLRWACTFHISCADFICVGHPTQTRFLVEYGLSSIILNIGLYMVLYIELHDKVIYNVIFSGDLYIYNVNSLLHITQHFLGHTSGYPLKSHFQIPCVFPVQSQIFPVPILMICDYYIHKIDLADLSSFKRNI